MKPREKMFKFKIPKALKNKWTYVAAGLVFVIGIPINNIYFKDQPDNPFEEWEEDVIESLSGIEIDLSPDSPE